MLNYTKQDAYAMYKTVVNKAKQMALNLTPLELKVEDATSNEPWGPHGTAMSGEHNTLKRGRCVQGCLIK